jgi:hypothetical protein
MVVSVATVQVVKEKGRHSCLVVSTGKDQDGMIWDDMG